jgi:hypothetical protein
MAVCACEGGDIAGEGSLELKVTGGAAVQQGFPHNENADLSHASGGARLAFEDGWETLTFDKFVMGLGNVQVRTYEEGGPGGRVLAEWNGAKLMDLRASAASAAELVTLTDIPAGRVDVGFDVLPANPRMERVGVTEADAERMSENGWAYLIAGVARRGAREVQLDLGIPAAGRYFDCNNGRETPAKNGIVIESEKTTGAFIYSHVVHLFWDTLASGDETLRFEAFAQAAGDDGVLTFEDLAGFSLFEVSLEGGDFYNDGGFIGRRLIEEYCAIDEPCLGAYVTVAMQQSVHFNGVGFCPFDALP